VLVNHGALTDHRTRRPPTKAPPQAAPIAIHKRIPNMEAPPSNAPRLDYKLNTVFRRKGGFYQAGPQSLLGRAIE